MSNKEKVIDDLCMHANHGTRYEDMEKAYNAGAKAERERWLKMDIIPYLTAASKSSMSRNNSENLAAEILQHIVKLPNI